MQWHAVRYTQNHCLGLADIIVTSVVGRAFASVCTLPNLWMVCMPLFTLPNTVCFPSRWGWGAKVIKNYIKFASNIKWVLSSVSKANPPRHTVQSILAHTSAGKMTLTDEATFLGAFISISVWINQYIQSSYLASIRVRTSVSHRQNASPSMFKVLGNFVFKISSVDALSSSSSACWISAL